jgi:glycogen debranching enzyme
MAIPPPSAFRALDNVRAAGGGLYASAGELYSDAVFGRDSVECAEDLLHLRPGIAVEVILALARLQGTVDATPGPRSNEEEIGKIHHEHRSLYVGERRISPRSQQMLEYLSELWGGDAHSFTYYGSADATPLYVRLVGRFCAAYGPAILNHPLTDKDGRPITVRDSVLAAVKWMVARIEASQLGLLEFCRTNPRGIAYQAWKDSGTSYVHRGGRFADHSRPIAAVEVQGYAYEALTAAARLFPDHAPHWLDVAEAVRQAILERFWMPDEAYFAMGLDRDPEGRPRRIESVASNGALLLGTSIFDGLPGASRYIEGLVRRICSEEFVTEVGVRCRSLAEYDRVDFQDYHGTWACWAKEGYDVADGLQRQGFARLARQLYWRILNGVNVAGAATEFLYVCPDQRVHYDFADRGPRSSNPQEIHGTNRPEPLQAWTVTALLSIKSRVSKPTPVTAARWRAALENDVLPGIPLVQPLRTAAEREAAYARRGDFVLNTRFSETRPPRVAGRGGGGALGSP